ncbi:hypothetical protein D9M68_117060 [compost metagenome]
MPNQSGGVRLLHRHEQVPRPELAAVGMAGQLQVETGFRRGGSGAWLVRQQHARPGVCRGAGDGAVRVAAVAFVEAAGGVVGHAAEYQRVAVVLQHHVFVHQHAHAQPAQLIDPRFRAGVVLMVAGDEVGAVARLQPGQRRGVGGQFAHGAVDQVAGDGDGVGLQAVDAVDDAVEVGPLDGGPDMDVTDLGDGETMQGVRQAGHGHVDFDHARQPAGIDIAGQRDQQRQQRHCRGTARGQAGRVPAEEPFRQPGGGQCHVAYQRQHQQG